MLSSPFMSFVPGIGCALLALIFGYFLLNRETSAIRAIFFFILVFLSVGITYFNMGLARPNVMRLMPVHGTLVGLYIQDTSEIYVWLVSSGDSQPISYMLPYSDKLGAKLESLMDNVEQTGQKVKLSLNDSLLGDDPDLEVDTQVQAPTESKP